MTHTLHRVGDRESLKKDILLYMVPSRGINAKDSIPKIQQFIEICNKYNPLNIGCLYPSFTSAQPKSILKKYTIQEIRDSVVDRTETIVTFTDESKVIKVFKDLKEADLGISVVVSGVFDQIFNCCKEADLTPHTVNIALGIEGHTELLPKRKVLDLVTMCGHGLVSPQLVENMVKKFKEGKITAEEAGKRLGKNCVCGAFNPARAAELIKQIAIEGFRG